jgi:hypothetical protein
MAGSVIVSDKIVAPLSSRTVSAVLTACVETFARATPVAEPFVLSNGTTYPLAFRFSSGTSASWTAFPIAWLKTAEPPMVPLVSRLRPTDQRRLTIRSRALDHQFGAWIQSAVQRCGQQRSGRAR